MFVSKSPPMASLTCLQSRSNIGLGPGYPSGCPGFWGGYPDGLQVRGCVVSRKTLTTVIVVVVFLGLVIVLLQFLR